MGQVNVNTPSDGEPAGSSGAGFILGIILAIIVIAALVYFLVLAGDGNGDTDPGDGNGDTNGTTESEAPAESMDDEAAPSGWRLVDIA
jgi:hypothetical protein